MATNNSDIIFGTSGNDTIQALGGNDLIFASFGNDLLNGGNGDDTVNYVPLASPVTFRLGGTQGTTRFVDKAGGTDRLGSIETIVGDDNFANLLDLSNARPTAVATVDLSFNTLFLSTIGNFSVVNFRDVIGTQNADNFFGNALDNNFDGGNGNDTFRITGNTDGDGDDIYNGNGGIDVADYSNAGGPITLGPTGRVVGSRIGTDTLVRVETIIGDIGSKNVIDASSALGSASVRVNLQDDSLAVNGVPGVGAFTVENFVDVIGTSNADRLVGDAEDNLLQGGAGNDRLAGQAGNDTLDGGAGNDIADLSAENSRTVLLPTGVVQQISGNTVTSTDQLVSIESIIANRRSNNLINARSAGGAASLTVNLQRNSLRINNVPALPGSLRVENFRSVNGTDNRDLIFGNNQANIFRGFSGNDNLRGGRGNDRLIGGQGNDSLQGDDGNDRLFGGQNDDVLIGGNGADELTGAGGALRGFGESDRLIGGGGADTFILGDSLGVFYLDALGGFKDGFATISGFTAGIDVLNFGAVTSNTISQSPILGGGGAVVGTRYFTIDNGIADTIAEVRF